MHDPITGKGAIGIESRHSDVLNPSIFSIMPTESILHLEFPSTSKIVCIRIKASLLWSGWMPFDQPFPSSCSLVRPVKSNQDLLKYVQSLSVPRHRNQYSGSICD